MRRIVAILLFLVFAPTHPAPVLASTDTLLRTAGASALLLGTAFALDPQVHPGFPDAMPGVLAEEPGETTGAATFLFGGTAALAAEGLLFHHPYSVETAKKLGIALTASSVAVTLLKLATHRERPDDSNFMSFPSGHTTVAFTAATVLQRQYGGIVGWVAYAGAAAAGEARIADNHHYLSDVVAGALLGHFIGRWVTRKSP